MKFNYKSKSKNGAIVNGFIEATDKFAAAKQLRDMGEIPISIVDANKKNIFDFLKKLSFGAVPLREKINFTKNLSGMLQAGLALNRALGVISKQTKNEKFRSIIDILLDTISKGGTLSAGMEKSPNTFSTLAVSMTRAGEESGNLSSALAEIGENMKKSYALKKKIKSAMMYPIIILCAIFMVGVLMLIYVVPTLTSTFKSIGAELPASTQFVIFISDFLKNHTTAFFLSLIVLVGLFILLLKNKKTQKYISFIALRFPIVGTIIKEINTARTARTISSLLKAGVSMSKALSITEDVLTNVYYKRVLAQSIKSVEKGDTLSGVFKTYTHLYPIMMSEMVEVGEETGKLSDMLLDVAIFYEEEVEAKTKDLSTIVEPVLMIFIGVAVGFFAISMLTPMYSILEHIG